MISADDAGALLRPLAQPTLEAFAAVRRSHDALDKIVGPRRDDLERAPRALLVGIEDWCAITRELLGAYRPLPDVVRDTSGHVLTYAWIVGGRVRLQLKSDAYALDVVQPPLPGMEDVAAVSLTTILLSWSPFAERPVFILRDGGHTVWQMTAESLLTAAPTAAIAPPVPRASLSSKRRPDATDAADTSG